MSPASSRLRGKKQLTVEDRTRLLAGPPLGGSDREMLSALRLLVTDHDDRIKQLEADVSVVTGRVESLFLSTTTSGRLGLAVPIPDLSPPLPVPRLSPRSRTVESLCRGSGVVFVARPARRPRYGEESTGRPNRRRPWGPLRMASVPTQSAHSGSPQTARLGPERIDQPTRQSPPSDTVL